MTIGMFALAVLLLFGSMLGSCGKEEIPENTEDTTPPIETEDVTPVSTINVYKRDVQGVIVMRIEEGNQVVAVQSVENEEVTE